MVMAYRSLRDFIDRLEGEGRLVRVKAPVSPHLEMTEIQTRLLAEGGPAVLFEHPVRADGTPYDMPVLVNLFGTVERVAWGMNREPHQLREVGETPAFLRHPEPPGGWREAVGGRVFGVTSPVVPHLERTEIHAGLLAGGGLPVLFEHPVRADGTPYDIPVLVNLFGTVERVAWGMNREPHQLREVGETLAFLRHPEPPGGWREAMGMLPLLKTVMAMKPRSVGSAPCQEVILTGDAIDLSRLPIQGGWPGEPAPLTQTTEERRV